MILTEAEQSSRVTRYEVMKRALIIFISVVVTVVLVGVFVGVHVLVGLARDNRQTLTTIRDCTQPSGACYRRGQQRTAEAVASLNAGTQQAAAAATSCAIRLSRQGKAVTYHSVYRCIVSTTRGSHR